MKSKIYCWMLFLCSAFLFSARTDRLVLEKPADFEPGKFNSAVLSSKGKIFSGKATEEIQLEAAAVWSLLELKPDQALIGTGNPGKLYQYEKGKLEQIFEDQTQKRLAISALAQSSKGEIYFAAIPKAAIFQLTGKTAKKIAEPELEYIWTLLPLANGSLLAGGGPKAKVLLIKPDGKSSQVAEFKAEQVVDIIDAGDGGYLAGTARPAMLIRFKLDGSYRVVSGFQQEELRGIRRLSDQSLILALNQGAMPPMQAMEPEGPPPGMESEEGPEQENPEEGPPPQIQIQPRMPAGRSVVYRFYPDRGMKQILALKQATIFALFGDEQNGFFVGTDDQGKVYQIFPGQDEVWLSYDLTPGKVVSFAGSKSGLRWIGTAQPARLYTIQDPAGQASYESKVLDAQFPSGWGRVEWRGKGKVNFLTRSGNTQPEDASWSKWEPAEGPELKIKSPAGRYIQVRAEWSGKEEIEISRVEISFKNLNQAQYLSELKIDVPNNPGEGRARPMPEGEGGPPQKPSASVLKQCQISWRLENPDQDQIFLELSYQQDGNDLWVPIAKGDEIKGTRFQWDASGLPDGWYRVKLIASDSPDNPEAEAFKAEQVSNLFLIDTTKPELSFSIAENGLVSGEAKDLTSAVSQIEFAVDDEDFRPGASLDDVLDQKSEKFEIKLKKLSKGTHRITVRACDQINNCGMKAQEFNVK